MTFAARIIRWYQRNKRPLPWRNTRNPYHIWLSEVILQQTRVDQGLPYFERFVAKYPTLNELAAAREDEVLKLWQGLGYYSRARNMLATARIVVSQHNGQFPQTAAELARLKGIGPYTAAAIASFAWGEAVPVVDGNVFRVISRYLGMETAVNSSQARKEFTLAAQELMDTKRPDEFNQAIMEFGALQCTPKNPDCNNCILHESCAARATGKVNQLPVKIKKTAPAHRYFHYMLIEHGTFTYIQQRTGNDIWKNLYELPLIETEQPLTNDEWLQHPLFKQWMAGVSLTITGQVYETRHLLSHRVINARFMHLRINARKNSLNADFQKIKISDIHTYPIPRILDIYLKNLNLI